VSLLPPTRYNPPDPTLPLLLCTFNTWKWQGAASLAVAAGRALFVFVCIVRSESFSRLFVASSRLPFSDRRSGGMWGRAAAAARSTLEAAGWRGICQAATGAGFQARGKGCNALKSAGSPRSLITAATAAAGGVTAASGTLAAATFARPPWRTIATAAARQQLTSGGGGSAIAQAVKQQLVARGTAVSAVAKQQSRGFAHFLHSPSRRGIGSNGLPRLGMDNSDRMLWSLIAANVGGWVLWRVAPNVVRARWGVSQSDGASAAPVSFRLLARCLPADCLPPCPAGPGTRIHCSLCAHPCPADAHPCNRQH
jgi:hypothetical protein